jgi:hypothetical protein
MDRGEELKVNGKRERYVGKVKGREGKGMEGKGREGKGRNS